MPYIKKETRDIIVYENGEKIIYPDVIENPGELNYALTEIIAMYLKQRGLSYQTINDIVGAIECCKNEFIRRVVNNYEDKKIIENGDIEAYSTYSKKRE